MKNLKDNITEALFSKKLDTKAISQNIEDVIKCELIKKYCGDYIEKGDIEVEVKNDEVYLTFNRDFNIASFTVDRLPKKLLPLNLKRIDITSSAFSAFFIYIYNSQIKSLKDVFADGFEVNEIKGKSVLDIIINNSCKNLTSLEGCPSKVDSFTLEATSKLKNLDGMPTWINSDVEITCPTNKDYTNDYVIDTHYTSGSPSDFRYELDSLYKGAFDDEDTMEDLKKDVAFLKDFYNHLDKNCPVAKTMEKTLKLNKYDKI